MEVEKDSICRLCLSPTSCDECQKLDSISQDILKVVVPEVDLNITHDPKICQSCYKTMLRCYRFKTTCTKGNDNPDVKKTSEVDTVSEELIKQCSFCSTNIDEEWLGKFKAHRFYFKTVLEKCLPEWTTLSPETVPCKSCLEVLTFHFAFIGNCSDTEDKLKNISTSAQGGTSSINLCEAFKFIPKKESDSADTSEYSDALQERIGHDLPFPEVAVKNESIVTETVDIKTVLDGELIENTVCYNSAVQGNDIPSAELLSGSGAKRKPNIMLFHGIQYGHSKIVCRIYVIKLTC